MPSPTGSTSLSSEEDLRLSVLGVAGAMRHSASADSMSSCARTRRGGAAGHSGRFSDTASRAAFAGSSRAVDRLSEPCMASLPAMPDCFRCPVSQRVMEDPVRFTEGQVCERANVVALGYKGKVHADVGLKEAIKGYLELQKDAEQRQEAWKAFMARQEQKVTKKLLLRQRQVCGLRVLLEQGRQSVRELKGRSQDSGSSTSTDASSVEETTSVDSPLSPGTEEPQSPTDDAPAAAQFQSGPAPRANLGAGVPKRPFRHSTWSGLFQGRK